jgi:hypothetical protein
MKLCDYFMIIVLSSYMWFSVFCLYYQLSKQHRKLTPEEEVLRWRELQIRRRNCKYNLSSNYEDNKEAETSLANENEGEMCTRSLDSLITQLHYDCDWVDSLMQRRYEEVPSDTDIAISLVDRATRFLRLSQVSS